MDVNKYDEWKLSTPWDKEKVAFQCEHCHEPVLVGEEFIKTNYGDVHDSCYEEFAWNMMNANKQEAEEEV